METPLKWSSFIKDNITALKLFILSYVVTDDESGKINVQPFNGTHFKWLSHPFATHLFHPFNESR